MHVAPTSQAPRRTRNAAATRARILSVAQAEFVANGLSGARMDRIAAASAVNKNLLYHYFGSKDDLYLAVIEGIYSGLRENQRDDELLALPPEQAMRRLIANTFDHFVATPDLIRLMSVENIHNARNLMRSTVVKPLYAGLLGTVETILRKGQAEGVFRRKVDVVDLYLSISGLAYFFLSNQHTLSWLLDRTLVTPRRIAARRQHMADMVLAYLMHPPPGGTGRGGKKPRETGMKAMWGIAGVATAFAVAVGLAAPVAAQEKLSVRLDFAPWGVQAAMHLANQQGMFKAAGLEVDVQDGRGSGNTIQLVNAGQADVGQVQVGLLGAARAQGAPLKAIATLMPKTDLCVLIDRTSPMTRAADLKGKTVVVFAASPWAPLIDPFLKSGDLNRETAKIDFVDPAALWGTYIAKRADGLMSTASSALPVAEASRASKCLWASDAGLSFMSYGLVVREDTIAKRGAALKKLVQTQQRAWEQIRKNPEDGVKAMLAARPDARLDPTVQRSQITMSLDFFETPATRGKPIGWQATADWEATLKTLEVAGVVKPGWKADDYFTNALMD